MPIKTAATRAAPFVLFASVVLNIGLLHAVLSRSSPEPQTVGSPAGSGESPARMSEPEGYAGYRRYYETLLSRGLSLQETKWLLLARLEMQAKQRAALPEPPYWQPTDTAQREYPLRLFAELDHVRTALTQVYGVGAERDPVFSALFQPLGPGFYFLSSAQQVEVQRLKLEQQTSAVMATAAGSPFPDQPPAQAGRLPASAAPLLTGFVSKLPGVLEGEALFEYQLRDSPLAEQLRGAQIQFSEGEFRETFEILNRLNESAGDSELYAASRNELRTLLGSRRFARFWASRDPLFAVIKRSCEEHSLTEEETLTVYEMFNDDQDRMIEIAKAAGNDPQRGAREVREERARLQRRLSELVGDDVAEDILRSHARRMLSLTKNLQPSAR